MVCTPIGGGWMCQPTRGRLSRRHGKCHGGCMDSGARIVRSEGSPWYGADYMCVECGDSWDSEGYFRRPLERAWRKKAIARHESMWQRACDCPVEYDEDHYALACGDHPEAV